MKERLRRRSTRRRGDRAGPRAAPRAAERPPRPRPRRGLHAPRLLLAAPPREARRGARRPRLRHARGGGRRELFEEVFSVARRGGAREEGPVTDALRRGLSPGALASSPATLHAERTLVLSCRSPTTRSRSCGWSSRASPLTASDSSTSSRPSAATSRRPPPPLGRSRDPGALAPASTELAAFRPSRDRLPARQAGPLQRGAQGRARGVPRE